MTTQLTIDGREEITDQKQREVTDILETYPVAVDDLSVFARQIARRRVKGFSQLDESVQRSIVQFAQDYDTMNRTRRKYKENIPM